MNDAQLIETFVKEGSETAFRSLVERHLPLVFGTARRITNDGALAEEITQTVFILLAQKARSLARGTIVSGWLYRTTCFVAARASRAERRRQRREQEAVAMQNQIVSDPSSVGGSTPHLDDALQQLSQKERNAVLLRFFEERPLRDVGASLGISEEAAKKRVTRALEKLRKFLQRRGIKITSVALAASLTQEAAKAAVIVASASKITAAALAPAAASSALLLDVLAAWRWAKLKLIVGVTSGAVATALVLSQTIPKTGDQTSPGGTAPITTRAGTAGSESLAGSNLSANLPGTMEFAGQTLPAHPLQITVLDATTGDPIAGAELTHSFMWTADPKQRPTPLRTDAKGTAIFPVPEHFPGDERMNQFEIYIRTKDYADREIMWLCSTGSVLNIVTNGYTVRLDAGIILSGTVVDDAGQVLAGVRVGAMGNNYLGYSYSTVNGKIITPPVLRVEDFPSFSRNSEGDDAVFSDRLGRFKFEHFPSDLKALVMDLIGLDGARQKFHTPQGKRLSADETPEVSLQDLQADSARLVLPHGITVEGVVVDAAGEPVIGATVSEGTQWGNLRVLSHTDTDYAGRFWLSNRPPREIILAASAAGHASASTVVTVKRGMETARIQLPPELPLQGRITDPAGTPVAGASIQLEDLNNEGLGFKWSAKSDAEGRFVWQGAPTNEIALAIESQDFARRLVRLRASTNEQMVALSANHDNNTVFTTGTVVDAVSGKPVEHFTVKVCHNRQGAPEISQITDGLQGGFSLKTSQSEVVVGRMAYWHLLIEADGYEALATRDYDYNEGDQNLDLKLQPGGTIEGTVRSTAGEPVAGCQLTVATLNDAVSSIRSGEFSGPGYGQNDTTTETDGHFKLSKPVNATSLIAFDENGWAITSIAANSQNLEIQLLPWGRIEGQLLIGNAPVPNEKIGLKNLIWDTGNPIQILQSVTTDESGHFVFEKVPAGEYEISLESQAWQRLGESVVKALQTPVKVSAGETNQVLLSETGRTAIAKLEAPKSSSTVDWKNAIAVLNRDTYVPPRPARSDFVTEASYNVAQLSYAHDPAVLAATRETRSYVGDIRADGSAVFANVPPGNYYLEVMLSENRGEPFKPNGLLMTNLVIIEEYNEPWRITGQMKALVTIPEDANESTSPVVLGSFTVDDL